MFVARPVGSTLRRIEDALHRPHSPVERTDPLFRVAMRCELCGKVAYGPRSEIGASMREHRESYCPKRRTHADSPNSARIFYPRQ